MSRVFVADQPVLDACGATKIAAPPARLSMP
jgi:hypothetical protein